MSDLDVESAAGGGAEDPGAEAGADAGSGRGRGMSLPGGLVDSATSSLASFVVGLTATRLLSPADLGVYALCFSAFLFASVVPASLIFSPVEVSMVTLDVPHRTRIFTNSLRSGPLIAVVAGIAVCAATLLIPSDVPFPNHLALAATAALLVAVSPVQDHVRRVLHAAGRSWAAAKMSGVTLVVTVAAMGIGLVLPVGRVWIVFTALAIGNAASLVVGWTILGVHRDRAAHGLDLRVPTVIHTGKWLLLGTGWSFAAGFAAVAILVAASGGRAAGYAEAARVLSQPVTVVVVGLLSNFNPVLTEAAARGDRVLLWRRLRQFLGIIGVLTVLWMLVTLPWPGNPLDDMFPNAYHDHGLLPLTAFEQAFGYCALAYTGAMVAVRRQRVRAGIEVAAGAIGVAVVFATTTLGSYALPVGGLAGAVVLHVGLAWQLRRSVGTGAPAGTNPVPRHAAPRSRRRTDRAQ